MCCGGKKTEAAPHWQVILMLYTAYIIHINDTLVLHSRTHTCSAVRCFVGYESVFVAHILHFVSVFSVFSVRWQSACSEKRIHCHLAHCTASQLTTHYCYCCCCCYCCCAQSEIERLNGEISREQTEMCQFGDELAARNPAELDAHSSMKEAIKSKLHVASSVSIQLTFSIVITATSVTAAATRSCGAY
jgi:hypothetical protein